MTRSAPMRCPIEPACTPPALDSGRGAEGETSIHAGRTPASQVMVVPERFTWGWHGPSAFVDCPSGTIILGERMFHEERADLNGQVPKYTGSGLARGRRSRPSERDRGGGRRSSPYRVGSFGFPSGARCCTGPSEEG